ncbi:MAG: cytochrome c biogenesis protein ResB [Phycisphaerae bacterium]
MQPEITIRLRRACLWAGLVGCLALAVLCVVPTFLGAGAPERWFTSPAGAGVWWALAGLLVGASLAVRSLHRRPLLLAGHLGLVLIVLGATWNSPTLHLLREKWFGETKVPAGYVILAEGETSGSILGRDSEPVGRLPFELRLEDFRIEHYPPDPQARWRFVVRTLDPGSREALPTWREAAVPWKPGEETILPGCSVHMRVLQVHRQDGTPEVEIRLRRGQEKKESLFAPQNATDPLRLPLNALYQDDPAWVADGAPVLFFQPPTPPVKDYVSEVTVLRDGKPVGRRRIEVNHPLHQGGYHLYQHSYDTRAGRFTVLRAVSDSGMGLVYAGFVTLLVGLGGHGVVRLIRHRRPRGGDA